MFRLLLLATFFTLISSNTPDQWDLVFIQALWRHGDRSPIFRIPKDKIKPEDWKGGGTGYGQLTPTGMSQHFKLGQKLRKYYDPYNLISKRYVANEIFVRSTDVNRTLISALSNMIGFYSGSADPKEDYPGDLQGWPTGFVPVPVHTVPADYDSVTGVHNCPYEKIVGDTALSSPEYIQLTNDNKDFISKVANLTGLDNLGLSLFPKLRDTLFIEKQWAKMPDGFDNATYDEIDRLASIVDDFYDGIGLKPKDGIDFSLEFPRLHGGPLLWSIIDHMNLKRYCLDKAAGKVKDDNKDDCIYFDTLKYYAFSAHDVTITALFSTFGFKESDWNEPGLPHYASCVTVELYRSKDGNNYKVEVLYWPELKGPDSLTTSVTGCQKGCSLEEFNKRSQIYKIENMDKYCKRDQKNDDDNGVSSILVSFLAISTTFILLI